MNAADEAGVRRGMDALLRPASICVLGASATRTTRGNIAIRSMQGWGFPGRILPVHPQAAMIEGCPAVPDIASLPPGVDAAFVAVSAAQTPDVIRRLDQAGVRAAVVIAAGFSPPQEAALRAAMTEGRILVHGPNCMGLLNLSDRVPLYTAEVSAKVTRGRVALLAQSGSAAVAVMNSLRIGFSKVVTVGSEYRLTASEYLDWLADDPDTGTIGVILESIQSPAAFAWAVRRVQESGRSLVVLKVGRSATGGLAAQAHTGAMTTPADAYDCFFRDLAVPQVADYEQLCAALTVLDGNRRATPGTGVAFAGISGGETALACDLATELGLPLAAWSDETAAALEKILPGVSGRNPLDFGASVGYEDDGRDAAALAALAADPAVGVLVGLQDMQASLPRQLLEKYHHTVRIFAALATVTDKPVVMLSPTPDPVHPALADTLADAGVPALCGLPAAVAGLRALLDCARRPAMPAAVAAIPAALLAALKAEIRAHAGKPLPVPLCQRILAAYGIPYVRSVTIAADGHVPPDLTLDFPVVVKVASAVITHRSDVGGVQLGVRDADDMRDAIAAIRARVAAARPDAVIEGFEIQEQMTGCTEALAGFSAVPPFDALTIVGTGGVLAELAADRAPLLGLADPAKVEAAIATTRLGRLLGGYRNLLPPTPTAALALLVSRLTRLGSDLSDVIDACDLNPVLVRPGSGDARAVDVLMTARGA